jgi:hypothetical protein
MADKRLSLFMLAAAGPARQAAPLAVLEGAQRSEAVNPLASLDKQSLRDMTERPLFTRTRRPPPGPAPIQAEPAFVPPTSPPSPDYMLLGIIRNGERATALLRSKSDGRNMRVQAGDTIGGWEIAVVGTVSVRLKRGDGAAHELRLAPR